MDNAKKEFLEEIENKKLICAKICISPGDYDKPNWIILKYNYTQIDFDLFLKKIDFDYDNGFGGQNLFGIILFKDSYSDRHEYDGSECWENHEMPTIEQIEDINTGCF